MLTVVTWLWGHHYTPAHVLRLQQSVTRWLDLPHRFLCITDRRVAGVETRPDPAGQFDRKCYRRLWMFSDEARTLGDRVLHLDLDLVICGPLAPLVTRAADFTIYRAGSIAAQGYSLNPSVLCFTTGTQRDLWETFIANPVKAGESANAAGFWGSDQAIISHRRRGAVVDTIADAEGVVSFRRIRSERLQAPPAGTRIVSFHGKRTPWEPDVMAAHPWIAEAWAA